MVAVNNPKPSSGGSGGGGGGITELPAGLVMRLSYNTGTSSYPAKTGPTGTEYEFIGPVDPSALMDEADSWIRTDA